jgi:hypothetical protein
MAIPSHINMVPNVASISGIFSLTISRVFIPATNRDTTSKVKMIARNIQPGLLPKENQTRNVIHTVFEREAVEPTERSMPFTVRAKVIPVAMIVTIQTDRIMVIMLEGVKKVGMARENPENKTRMVMSIPHLVMKFSIWAFLGISITSGGVVEQFFFT